MQVSKGRPVGTKEGWGYFVWVGAALMLAVPEITGAISNGALGFKTVTFMATSCTPEAGTPEPATPATVTVAS